MKLVASGILDPEDPDLAVQLKEAEARRRRAEEEVALVEAQTGTTGPKAITPAKVQRLGEAIRIALEQGDPRFRRAYLCLFVGKVTVGDEEIRISDPTPALARQLRKDPGRPLWPTVLIFIAYGVA